MNDAEPLEVSLHIDPQPETVLPSFTDPDRFVQWMITSAELEPRPSGVYRVSMGDGVHAAGEFVEVDSPRRLVFTWGWNHDEAARPGRRASR